MPAMNVMPEGGPHRRRSFDDRGTAYPFFDLNSAPKRAKRAVLIDAGGAGYLGNVSSDWLLLRSTDVFLETSLAADRFGPPAAS
jgi:hypothetical protein